MIKNISYELAATFTREQVIAIGRVAEFVGNIETDIKTGFPSSGKTINWEAFRQGMTIFSQMYAEDKIAVAALTNVVHKVNNGEIGLLAGKPFTKENS